MTEMKDNDSSLQFGWSGWGDGLSGGWASVSKHPAKPTWEQPPGEDPVLPPWSVS